MLRPNERRTAPTWHSRSLVRAALGIGLVGTGMLLALALGPSTAPRGTEPSQGLDPRIEELRADLGSERAAREALSREVAELRARLDVPVATARTLAAGDPYPGAASVAPVLPTATDPKGERAGNSVVAAASGAEDKPVFDEEGLEAVGLRAADVRAIRERWEKFELDRLELSDRAMREGWFMTPRHGDEHRALVAAFQADVGQDGYDAYLYAIGQENRVVVREVLPNSTARATGLQPGDEIVGYDGATVYSTAELQFRTASGSRGDVVSLDVVRAGRSLTLRAERGPLGVVVAGSRRPPRSP